MLAGNYAHKIFFFLKGFVAEEHTLFYLFKGWTPTKIPAWQQKKKNNPSTLSLHFVKEVRHGKLLLGSLLSFCKLKL